ncbi:MULTISPECIES: ubiquinol-cytochrome c reductase iron-sulfur subunit [unclassified Leucobacter]|uniref:cytochrome bc1 complex Rieske iron-sulfur subunit n=1 Tax=unclassified Leucobacter TaxID=2621730 RepID=UPI00165EB4CA|nr:MULTISPECIES: Rieske 2Fe-2S domain-containing protein [unclassified Leucobacter]MBC9928408.1 Rieske (2Fe-2S) protein [Leucobacter sp. cx-169]MBC9935410.1 Rieske (2Fe-2S) protein [Leucobacter sp. cx-87]
MAEEAKNGSEGAVVAAQRHGGSDSAVGTAVISPDAAVNPGLPPHRKRVTDLDPKKDKSAERVVYTLFYVSIVGSLAAVLAYMFIPIETGELEAIRLHTMLVGTGMTLALLALGVGAVHWGKAVMADHESVDERHPVPSSPEVRAEAAEVFTLANEESGFSRRSLVRNSLIGALLAFPIPGVVLLRGLAPQDIDPVEVLKHTMWDKGVRLARDPSGIAIKAADVTIGSVFHVIPENLNEGGHILDEKAKAIVLLMRLDPEDLNEPEDKKSWSYNGIVAYSKVCTHVGCPVALYEQHTHHLLCPCHQSQFDVSDGAKVVFGPAKRPLPQLPITVDDEGYLVAQSDFHEPVGPSYWERLK